MKNYKFVFFFGINFLLCSMNILAQTTVNTTVPESKNPNMENYCDPAHNTDVLAKIRDYEKKLEGLQPMDAKALEIKEKISKQVHKLKCIYRPIAE
ncbi:MAG: hypothetical protein V4525_07985 [Pseudomonadota bacterium]